MKKRPAKKKTRSASKTAAAAPAPPKAEPPASLVATIAAVARHCEVHERTVKTWFANGCPHERGRYDLAAIEAWREANIGVGDDDSSSRRGYWETRRSAAVALRAELELKREEGRLIDVGEASRVLGQHIVEVKAHLNQLPAFAASLVKLTAAQKRDFLDAVGKKIRRLCEGFEASLTALAKAAAEKGEAAE